MSTEDYIALAFLAVALGALIWSEVALAKRRSRCAEVREIIRRRDQGKR